MTDAVLFSESYYRRVLAEFGYTPFDLRRFDFTLAGLDADTLNTRYLCHHHGEQYLRAAPQRRIVTTGFGMSGVPHLATVSHILKTVELQRGGERCQIVLGDLDAYNGKAKPYVEELAERFREYTLQLGFDANAGIVQSQEGYLPALGDALSGQRDCRPYWPANTPRRCPRDSRSTEPRTTYDRSAGPSGPIRKGG